VGEKWKKEGRGRGGGGSRRVWSGEGEEGKDE